MAGCGRKEKEKDKMNEKLIKIKHDKLNAFDNVIQLAIELLPNSSPNVFELIQTAFTEYEKQEDEEHKFVKKHSPKDYTLLYILFTSKTIADIYWALPEEVKTLWNAVPELKEWKEEFR
jgi:hypothetical protein